MPSRKTIIMLSSFQMDVLLWLLLVSTVDTSDLEFQILQPAKVAFHGHVVKVVEGSNFQIVCSHKDQASLSESWTKGNVRKWGRLLSIMKLNKSHAGNYTCAVKECSRTITLAVLYPPENVGIVGPYNVLRNSQAQFTCFAESNPPSTFWWTTDPSINAPRISTGAIFAMQSVDPAYNLLYCFAENKMVPTVGDPITQAAVSTLRHITVQETANIRDLPDEYGVYVGSTVDILCLVDGNPAPVVWWTKGSEDGFYRSGARLTEQNVKTNFAGVYSCNARNVVRTNGSDQIIHTTKNIDVKVLGGDHGDSEDAGIIILVSVSAGLKGTQLNLWAVVATATGWFVVMVVVARAVIRKCRKKRLSKSCNRPKETSIELATVCTHRSVMDTCISDSKRLIPETRPKSQSRSSCECGHYLHAGPDGVSEETQRKVVGASNSCSDFTGLYELL